MSDRIYSVPFTAETAMQLRHFLVQASNGTLEETSADTPPHFWMGYFAALFSWARRNP